MNYHGIIFEGNILFLRSGYDFTSGLYSYKQFNLYGSRDFRWAGWPPQSSEDLKNMIALSGEPLSHYVDTSKEYSCKRYPVFRTKQ